MQTFRLSIALLAVSVAGFAQTTQAVKDPELTRYFDRVSRAMLDAQSIAASGDSTQFRGALKAVNEAWEPVYSRYRAWATSDTNWQTDFDAIQTFLINATNAITPGDNLPNASAQLDAAAAKLSDLRERNGVPDLIGTAEDMGASIKSLQDTVKSLQGKRYTNSDYELLKADFDDALTSWKKLTQAVIDTNVLGLSSGQLDSLQRVITLQNVAFETLDNVLKNPDTLTLLNNLQDIQDRLASLMSELTPSMIAAGMTETDATESATPTDAKSNSRRLFPRRHRLLAR
ncbi:MAG: hypothetical protein K1Y02_11070 [Candidatus Hydrogenedentes bacterium]|nr:hypothetical protein [Candidatus Hydrogenedentota bacterium]